MANLTDSLKSAEIWPIKAKGAVTRLNPLSDPQIEKNYHKAMEQGRVLECSISDANFILLERKKQIIEKITTYMRINTIAVDAQNKHRVRKFLLIADSVAFLKEVAQFQQDISAVISAATKNIGILQSIEQNMLGMVQANLNALANLINNVCNWGLPDLPAIPNFFSDTVWYWNGFNFFPLAAFQPKIGFDFNFAFNQCVIHVPNINIFRNYPSTTDTYSGLTYGTPFFVPPLGGIIVNTGQNLSDPNFIQTMQATTNQPYYSGFNPNSSMLGSVPDPSTIISNYQMPSQMYQDNIVSIVPALRGDVIEPTDADYNNPDLTTRQANLRRDLVHYVTLQQVVDSNYDPNLTAAWLFYLDSARIGRAGIWIPNIQDAYTQFVTPSVTYLASNPTPWNNVLGGLGVSDAPTAIPLIGTITGANSQAQMNLLWKLSYIEAAILGYTRNKNFDGGADNNFVSSFTGTDLDYTPTVINSASTTTEILGQGTATFPVSCTFPTAIKAVLDQVIAVATINIQNDTAYQSPHPKFKFVYDQFATATMVDRFTQFWREFNANLQLLLVQDPFLVQFVVSYVGSLDAAVDPLGNPADYNTVAQDVATRNRLWVPGTPLLNIPKAPVVSFSNGSTPTDATNGWIAPPTDLDATAFLSRPDIQGQPVPVQLAMLRTNLSYAGVQKYSQAMQAEIAQQISTANQILAQAQQFGFQVGDDTAVTVVLPGPGTVVAFDTLIFDMTSNVTDQTTFTIQQAGTYATSGQLDWEAGAAGLRTVTITQNGMPVFTDSTDPTTTGPTAQQFSVSLIAEAGDVFQVVASHDLPSSQSVGPGSAFSMLQSSTNTTPIALPSSVTSLGKDFEADVAFATLSAVAVQPDGGVIPVNPVIPAVTNVTINGSNLLTIAAVNKFKAGDWVLFANLGTATFLNGQVVQVLASGLSGTQFTANFTHAPYPSAPETVGQAIKAIDSTGVPLAPYPDGVALAPGVVGKNTSVATNYGGVFQTTSTGWTVGGLLYVAADGTLTQDFDSLLTTVGWVICVGRVIAADAFIYEPHIPQRFSSLF